MKIIADLHVHSKFSRATAKNLDLENLYIAAQLKGITVVGTGDFTYPQWFSEIREKLTPCEAGLFKLREDIAIKCDEQVPESCRGRVRFLLTTEISNIYKKKEKTRKNHNLVLVPDLNVAEKFISRLDKIGNIRSDGRPILGLDARDLFEILLDSSDQNVLIPAHIWTPWFSALGSKSGFDSIEECFDDLTPYIFAVETGLSSDPAMNWRVSCLDGFTLVSNSDAHSPLNLGREANLLDIQLSYPAIVSAIKSGDSKQFLGTIEFYPEEGKYHLDGHRNCDVRLWPEKTMAYDGICPECGKPLTIGVLYRVEELADRKEGQKPQKNHPYYNMIPLFHILSEILKVGPNSKRVRQAYFAALGKLGPEFNILHTLDPSIIDQAGIPLLAEAVQSMRQKKIKIIPGYDGEYGKIKIFNEQEREHLQGQKSLFSIPEPIRTSGAHIVFKKPLTPEKPSVRFKTKTSETPNRAERKYNKSADFFKMLNHEQRRAVEYTGGPLLIMAGPGTGKTRTLTCRIAHLINEKKVSPRNVLAVTFTHKAAQEMQGRLETLLETKDTLPLVATFHALCLKMLKEINQTKVEAIIDDVERKSLINEAIHQVEKTGIEVFLKPQTLLKQIVSAKQQILSPDDVRNINDHDPENEITAAVYQTYQRILAIQGLSDYEDLIFRVVRLFEDNEDVCLKYQQTFPYIFVDEYQDINQAQYRMIRLLAPPENSEKNICAIGDPDQSIYGFRGSDVRYFKRFLIDYPEAGQIKLTQNYRSTQTILSASSQVIQAQHSKSSDTCVYSKIEGVKTISILELASEKAEAEAIARIIEQKIGGTGFHSVDTTKDIDANVSRAFSYADFAVLYRTNEQHKIIAEVFDTVGIPFQIASRDRFFQQKGLAQLVSFLKIIEGYGSYADFENIVMFLMPAIGKKTIDQFKDWCYQNRFNLQEALLHVKRFPISGMSKNRQQMLNECSDQIANLKKETKDLRIAEKVQHLVEKTQISSILRADARSEETYNDFLALAEGSEALPLGILALTALQTDTDVYAPQVEKVSLMTMHAAKGLEFPVVFIAGCEKDLMPLKPSKPEDSNIKEERRLFYVAMTRAMEMLYFTRAKKRRVYGKRQIREISPFLADIEEQLKKNATPQIKKKKKDAPLQLQLF